MNYIIESIMTELEKELKEKHKRFDSLKTYSYVGFNGLCYVFYIRLKYDEFFGIEINEMESSESTRTYSIFFHKWENMNPGDEAVKWFFKKYGKIIKKIYQDILTKFETISSHPHFRLYTITHDIRFYNEAKESGLEDLLKLEKKKTLNFPKWLQTRMMK